MPAATGSVWPRAPLDGSPLAAAAGPWSTALSSSEPAPFVLVSGPDSVSNAPPLVGLTDATKRYPRLGTVSTYFSPSAIAPSARRSANTWYARLLSSTNEFGQTSLRSSSFVMRRPGLAANAARTSNAFGVNGTGQPSRKRRRSDTSSVKSPNWRPARSVMERCAGIVAFRLCGHREPISARRPQIDCKSGINPFSKLF